MYAAFFVKPTVDSVGTERPAVEQRDLIYSVTMPADNEIWAVGNYGKVIISQDEGATWDLQSSGVSSHLQSMAAWSADRAVAVGNDLTVIYTSDGGKEWAKASVVAPKNMAQNKLLRVRVAADGQAVAVGEFGTIILSSDFGKNWHAVSAGGDTSWFDASIIDAQSFVIVGEVGHIKKTIDGGATWADLPSATESTLNSVFFRDPQHGMAAGTGGVVVYTSDSGETWTLLPKLTSQHIFDVMWDGTRWVLTGDKGLLLFGSPDATTWDDATKLTDSSWHTQAAFRNGVYALAGRGGINIIKPDSDNKKNGN